MNDSLQAENYFENTTFLHPAVMVLLIALSFLLLCGRRHSAMAAILIVLNFVTSAQRVSFAGIDFPVLRIVVCLVVLRAAIRNEYSWVRVNRLDGAVFAQIFFIALFSIARQPVGPTVVYVVSTVIDTLGGYLAVRVLVRDRDDFRRYVGTLMWIAFLAAGLFFVERVTGRNPAAAFGGVAELTWVREGKMRVQGPYPHPILAGAYWATIIPLFLAMRFRNGKRRVPMYLAAFCGVLVVVLCASSTPLMSLAVGFGGAVLYVWRNRLGRFKAVVFAAVVALAALWTKPVWYLLAKIDFTGGSTGYFRYFLIDSFVRNWRQWILIGTRSTTNWGAGMVDVCNQYVATGINGGILGLGSFMASIALAFFCMGKLCSAAASPDESRDYWFLGVSVLVHLFNFIGVSYFGQITLSWGISLAICSSLYQTGSAKA